jgi:hypothetical protein
MPDLKRIFILSVLIPLGMICSCQKQDSAAEQQLTQRKAELDAREQAFDERVNRLEKRMNELDKRVSALAEREISNAEATAPAAQPQVVIRDPAQVNAEIDSGLQQTPADAQASIAEPLHGDPEKAEKDRMRELAQPQRGLDRETSRRLKLEQIQRWRMSHAAVSSAAEAASSTPSPAVESNSPTPSPTPP